MADTQASPDRSGALEDRESLRKRLEFLQREYEKTALRLQRAERKQEVRRHVRSRISEHNQPRPRPQADAPPLEAQTDQSQQQKPPAASLSNQPAEGLETLEPSAALPSRVPAAACSTGSRVPVSCSNGSKVPAAIQCSIGPSKVPAAIQCSIGSPKTLVPIVQCSSSSSSCSVASSCCSSCSGSPLSSRVPAVRFLLPTATTSPSHSPTSSPAPHRLRSKRSRLRLAQRTNEEEAGSQTTNKRTGGLRLAQRANHGAGADQRTNDRAAGSQTTNNKVGKNQRANHRADSAKTANSTQPAGERAVGMSEERESRWNREAGLPVSESQSDGSQLSVSLLSCQSNAARPPPHSVDSQSEASQLSASLLNSQPAAGNLPSPALDNQSGQTIESSTTLHYPACNTTLHNQSARRTESSDQSSRQTPAVANQTVNKKPPLSESDGLLATADQPQQSTHPRSTVAAALNQSDATDDQSSCNLTTQSERKAHCDASASSQSKGRQQEDDVSEEQELVQPEGGEVSGLDQSDCPVSGVDQSACALSGLDQSACVLSGLDQSACSVSGVDQWESSYTLVEGLPFPAEYYVRTTRRMATAHTPLALRAVNHGQLQLGGRRGRGGRGRGGRGSQPRQGSAETTSCSPAQLGPIADEEVSSGPRPQTRSEPIRARRRRRGAGWARRRRTQIPIAQWSDEEGEETTPTPLSEPITASELEEETHHHWTSSEPMRAADVTQTRLLLVNSEPITIDAYAGTRLQTPLAPMAAAEDTKTERQPLTNSEPMAEAHEAKAGPLHCSEPIGSAPEAKAGPLHCSEPIGSAPEAKAGPLHCSEPIGSAPAVGSSQLYPIFNMKKRKMTHDISSLLLPPVSSPHDVLRAAGHAGSCSVLTAKDLGSRSFQEFHLPDEEFGHLKLLKLRPPPPVTSLMTSLALGVEPYSPETLPLNTRRSNRRHANRAPSNASRAPSNVLPPGDENQAPCDNSRAPSDGNHAPSNKVPPSNTSRTVNNVLPPSDENHAPSNTLRCRRSLHSTSSSADPDWFSPAEPLRLSPAHTGSEVSSQVEKREEGLAHSQHHTHTETHSHTLQDTHTPTHSNILQDTHTPTHSNTLAITHSPEVSDTHTLPTDLETCRVTHTSAAANTHSSTDTQTNTHTPVHTLTHTKTQDTHTLTHTETHSSSPIDIHTHAETGTPVVLHGAEHSHTHRHTHSPAHTHRHTHSPAHTHRHTHSPSHTHAASHTHSSSLLNLSLSLTSHTQRGHDLNLDLPSLGLTPFSPPHPKHSHPSLSPSVSPSLQPFSPPHPKHSLHPSPHPSCPPPPLPPSSPLSTIPPSLSPSSPPPLSLTSSLGLGGHSPLPKLVSDWPTTPTASGLHGDQEVGGLGKRPSQAAILEENQEAERNRGGEENRPIEEGKRTEQNTVLEQNMRTGENLVLQGNQRTEQNLVLRAGKEPGGNQEGNTADRNQQGTNEENARSPLANPVHSPSPADSLLVGHTQELFPNDSLLANPVQQQDQTHSRLVQPPPGPSHTVSSHAPLDDPEEEEEQLSQTDSLLVNVDHEPSHAECSLADVEQELLDSGSPLAQSHASQRSPTDSLLVEGVAEPALSDSGLANGVPEADISDSLLAECVPEPALSGCSLAESVCAPHPIGSSSPRVEQEETTSPLQHTHTLKGAVEGCVYDVCCVRSSSGVRSVCVAGESSVCVWTQDTLSPSHWTLTHTWNFTQSVLSLFSVPDSDGLLCVTLGPLEITHTSVLSTVLFSQAAVCEGAILHLVVGVANCRLACCYAPKNKHTHIKIHTLTEEGSVGECVNLSSSDVRIESLVAVENEPDALIGWSDSSALYIWNMRSGHLLRSLKLGHMVSMATCLRGYSHQGVVCVLLQRECVFTLLVINPMTGHAAEALTHTTQRFVEMDVIGPAVVGVSASGRVVLWDASRGGTKCEEDQWGASKADEDQSGARKADEDQWGASKGVVGGVKSEVGVACDGCHLVRWAGSRILLTGLKNGDVCLYRYTPPPRHTHTHTH